MKTRRFAAAIICAILSMAAPVVADQYCTECGTQHYDTDNYCRHCGAPLPNIDKNRSREQAEDNSYDSAYDSGDTYEDDTYQDNADTYDKPTPSKPHVTVTVKLPAIPRIYLAARSTNGNYIISWNRDRRAKRYIVQEDTNPLFVHPKTVYRGRGTRYNVRGKRRGNYWYRIRAIGYNNRRSNWSPSRLIRVKRPVAAPATPRPRVKTPPPPPKPAPKPPVIKNPPRPAAKHPVPVLKLPTRDSDGKYIVSWSAVSGTVRYALQESRSRNFASARTVHNGASRVYRAVHKKRGRFYYRVRAYGRGWSTPWSMARSIKIK